MPDPSLAGSISPYKLGVSGIQQERDWNGGTGVPVCLLKKQVFFLGPGNIRETSVFCRYRRKR